jgi:hypothetical protein
MCFSLFKKPEISSSSKPTKSIKVSSTDIFNILTSQVPMLSKDTAHIYLSDNTYWLCSYSDIQVFIEADDTNRMNYVSEELDCDDFSYRLMGQFSIKNWSGIAFGIVWTDLHALNCFIDDERKFWFIEPQTGEIENSIDPRNGTEILLVVM